MTKKIILIFTLFILMMSVVSAHDNSTDNDRLTESIGSLTVKVNWIDDNNADNLRPDFVGAHFEGYGDFLGDFSISSNDNWQKTWDNLDNYEVTDQVQLIADNVEGYTVSVAGNLSTGYTITYTLVKESDNDTSDNQTDDDNNDVKENETQGDDGQVTDTQSQNVTHKADKKPKKPIRDKHNTGYPILLGVLAVSAAGLAFQLRRKE